MLGFDLGIWHQVAASISDSVNCLKRRTNPFKSRPTCADLLFQFICVCRMHVSEALRNRDLCLKLEQ